MSAAGLHRPSLPCSSQLLPVLRVSWVGCWRHVCRGALVHPQDPHFLLASDRKLVDFLSFLPRVHVCTPVCVHSFLLAALGYFSVSSCISAASGPWLRVE